LTLFYSNDSLKEAQKVVLKYDAKIKEAGRKGYFVGAQQKAEYDHAKQCESVKLKLKAQFAARMIVAELTFGL